VASIHDQMCFGRRCQLGTYLFLRFAPCHSSFVQLLLKAPGDSRLELESSVHCRLRFEALYIMIAELVVKDVGGVVSEATLSLYRQVEEHPLCQVAATVFFGFPRH